MTSDSDEQLYSELETLFNVDKEDVKLLKQNLGWKTVSGGEHREIISLSFLRAAVSACEISQSGKFPPVKDLQLALGKLDGGFQPSTALEFVKEIRAFLDDFADERLRDPVPIVAALHTTARVIIMRLDKIYIPAFSNNIGHDNAAVNPIGDQAGEMTDPLHTAPSPPVPAEASALIQQPEQHLPASPRPAADITESGWLDVLISEGLGRKNPSSSPSANLMSYFDYRNDSPSFQLMMKQLEHCFQKLVAHFPPTVEEQQQGIEGNDDVSPPSIINDATGELSSSLRDTFCTRIITQILTLYYAILEILLEEESIRLNLTDTTNIILLQSDVFYRSLLLVVSEVIFKQNSCSSTTFPCGLSLFEVDPFDRMKVSESFMRIIQEYVTEEIQTHMRLCEEMSLDSLCWVSGQSLVNIIEKERIGSTLWPPASLQLADVRAGTNALLTLALGDVVSTGKSANENALNYFFRKLLKFMAKRIYMLCDKLSLSSYLKDQIWTAWKHSLSSFTELYYDRHVDQVMLCTVYGVCKMSKQDATFTKIIHCYEEMYPGREILNNIIIREIKFKGEAEAKNIIHMYNQEFVPSVKRYLITFQHLGDPSINGHSSKRQKLDDDNSNGPIVGPIPYPYDRASTSQVGGSQVKVVSLSNERFQAKQGILKGKFRKLGFFGECGVSSTATANKPMRMSTADLKVDETIDGTLMNAVQI